MKNFNNIFVVAFLFCNNFVHSDIICPDPEFSCDDDCTCCQLKSGDYGCCPFQNAVCCSDKLHCCPADTICNLKEQECDSVVGNATQAIRQPIQYKTKAKKKAVDSFTTCCRDTNGGRAYCPMSSAVCCSDRIHCCPKNTTCHAQNNKCVMNDKTFQSIPLTANPPHEASVNERKVSCGNGTFMCPDETTCCKLASSKWGCCPMPNAVCCTDGIHCCPENTICDLTASQCLQKSVKWDNRRPTVFTMADIFEKIEVTCSDSSKCPTNSTCCQMDDANKKGCCPTSDAICCSDGKHCCPKNTVCDLRKGQCVKNDIRSPWSKKLALSNVSMQALAAVVKLCIHGDQKFCPDHTTQCFTNQTCCKFNNLWSCCPFPEAECCLDSPRCCPKGERCGTKGQSCVVVSSSCRADPDTEDDATQN